MTIKHPHTRRVENQLEKSPGSDLPGPSAVPGIETKQTDGSTLFEPTLWEVRTQEQPYAYLQDKEVQSENRYGQKIDLLELTGLADNRSMHINENPEVGINPNRNKQHGFFFTADNCIGCHACEAACAEKNETPAHLAFRSVGYVEGGSYPDYQRMNISMACNHCDDPVCLKGCPTAAYTKHAEYGAVLQDPDTCFGCGYCTWVCPYNAPQLDPIQGQVSKCNMCVDRLEVNLKPACVSACLGNALDFGVIENIPENREQAKTSIPGFPDPSITHPNIRFQQTRRLPDEMTRTDSMPVKYHKDDAGDYKPVIDQKKGKKKYWGLERLNSRENPLVLFTLFTQAAIGTFVVTFVGALLNLPGFSVFASSVAYAPILILAVILASCGSLFAATHLGKPKRFYRGFNNLKFSPFAREAFGVALFTAMAAAHTALSLPANDLVKTQFKALFNADIAAVLPMQLIQSAATIFGLLALIGAAGGLYYMYKTYRIKARPFWNHWQTATSFGGNVLALGGLICGTFMSTSLVLMNQDFSSIIIICGAVIAVGLCLEAVGLIFHSKDMNNKEHEGAASYYIQLTTFGKTYYLRNTLLGLNIILTCGLITLTVTGASGLLAMAGWVIVAGLLALTCLIGRALFYILVVPTTMPGAFFWKNKGFEEHARDIGLAEMEQVGVIANPH